MNARLVALVVLAGPLAARAEPTRPYVVKAGDTCLGIAARELGDSSQLAALHRLNPQLGALPHQLVPGQVIKVAVQATSSPDANLTFQHGDVEVRRAGEENWARTPTGADLFRAWRVGSHERASAQVTFADRSTIGMRENTVVVIFGPTRSGAQVGAMRASLESGALRSKLAALDGRPVVVTTPASVTTLTKGSAVVAVDKAGTTRVSNHTGKPASVASRTRAKKTARVKPGFGTAVQVGAEPLPPRPLPPSPVWGPVPGLAIAWTGHNATFQAAWAPVPAATKYRLELSTDAALTAVVLRFEAPGNADKLELREVPPGEYWLSVIALDEHGLESVPATPKAIRVAQVPMPAGSTMRADRQRLLVPLGAEISAGPELGCTLDGSADGALVADTAGHHSFACVGKNSVATRIDVDIAAVRITSSAPQLEVGGAPASIDVELEGGVAPLGTLELRGPTGIVVGAPERTTTGVRFSIAATPAATLGSHALELVVSTAGARRTIPVDRVAVRVAGRATAAGASWLELDAVAGLGGADRIAGEMTRVGLGLHATVYRRLGVEIAVSHSMTSRAPTLIRLGGDLALLDRMVTPSLRAGVLAFSDGDDAGGYVGAGLRVRTLTRVDVIANVDGLRDGRGNFVEIVAGMRIALD